MLDLVCRFGIQCPLARGLVRDPTDHLVSPDGPNAAPLRQLMCIRRHGMSSVRCGPHYRFTAIPSTSNRAPKSSVPAPMKARAGNSVVK